MAQLFDTKWIWIYYQTLCMSRSIYHKTHINMIFLLQNNNWILVSEKKKKKNSDILPKKSIHGFILLAGPEGCNKEKILQDTCSNYPITTQGHSRNKYSLAASREEWTNQREARQSKKMIRQKQVKSRGGH